MDSIDGHGVILLVIRSPELFDPRPPTIDLVAAVAWLALLISPLFAEMDLFGFRLRREIRELREEVASMIFDIRSDIQSSQSLNATISPSITFPVISQPSPDNIREALEPYLREVLYKTLRSYGAADKGGGDDPYQTPETTDFLFGVRYNLENRLRAIWRKITPVAEEQRQAPVARIIAQLLKIEVLDPDIAFMIREVYSICSSAIHGGDITDEQLQFVQNNTPSLYAYLDAVGAGWVRTGDMGNTLNRRHG